MADIAFKSEECLFRLRPKLHYFAHLLNFVAHTKLNPRRYDLFGAEDFMGKVKKLVKRVHKVTASSAFIRRYIIF